MAQGDITERVLEAHYDYTRNRVSFLIQRLIELPDGTLWNLDTRAEQKDFVDTKTMEGATLEATKADVVKDVTAVAVPVVIAEPPQIG